MKADEAARDLLLSGRAYEQGVRDGYGLANMLAESGCPMAGIARRAHSTNLQGGRL